MVTLDTIENYTTPMERFPLRWRFTDEEYNVLPPVHLAQVRPLEPEAARLLWSMTITLGIHEGTPYGADFFERVEGLLIPEGSEDEKVVKKWLYQRGLPFDKPVFLSWQPDLAVITTWKILVKYWSDFYYPISDDLSVFDRSLTWALLFFHEDELYFGANFNRDGIPEQETQAVKYAETMKKRLLAARRRHGGSVL